MKAIRFVSAVLMALAAICNAQPQGGFHLVKKMLVGGEGGWDYLTVDSHARRLYVTHSDRVVVLDADSLTAVGAVMNCDGLHGVAIAEESGHGFASNGRPSTVTMFDLKTLDVIKQIPTGKKPDAIIFDPASKKVFAFCGQGEEATVIDPDSGTVVASIPLGGGPEFGAADGQGHVYVNLEDKSELVAIDSRNFKVINRWSLAPGEAPSGLAIDIRHRRLFSGCRNKLMVVSDPDSGKVIATLPIGSGVDGCGFDPGTEMAFSTNGEGTLTVVHEDSPASFVVVENAATQRGARTIAVDPVTHSVFTATAEFGEAPSPTPDHPRPRPPIIPNTFVVLQYQR
ncbi:MAG TPA: YncE family protein [Bacteroidota bacterium]|nr:YncE family protein [Bacteroidota bacterium]